MGKVIAGKVSDIDKGEVRKFSINGKDVLVANIDGSFYAVDDTCTHSGASLAEGKLQGSNIVCGWHGAEFDCKTGKLAKFPAKIRDLQQYKVSVESDNIFIEV